MARKKIEQVPNESKADEQFEPTLLRRSDLAKILRCTISNVDKWVSQGRLPRPVRLGGRFVAWHKKVIDAWIAETFHQNDTIA